MPSITRLTRIKWTKSKIILGFIAVSFISLVMLLFMVDVTSKIAVSNEGRKKSALSIFTDRNYSVLRSISGQISSYQKSSSHLKRTIPLPTCIHPVIISNASAARLRPDVSFVTLDEVCWQTFGDNMSTVGKMSRLSNKLLGEMNVTAVLEERNQTADEVFHDLGLMIDVEGYIYLPGGHWKPIDCDPKWKVAFVVPFRDRIDHLAIFLRHMIPILQLQKLEFSIFIVEQNNNMSFNRAMLLNVGFLEALKLTRYDCYVFHDVDHLALNANNYYGCDSMPRHFISGDDYWDYRILYDSLFGGVTGLTTSQMRHVNGFSNMYWGWGAEDDDIYKRVLAKGYFRSRPEGPVGYYNTIHHDHTITSASPELLCLLEHSFERTEDDGLNSITYQEPDIELTPLFTKISVDIRKQAWKERWTKCDPLPFATQNHENDGNEQNGNEMV
ncbi:beta-1,4-galactosyltransferase 6-like [Lytechinus variegatus]|uniref:beta-1,4-galactosyltransferase 6-like n=1 Tax=Lytechinus variegatus TaxID=7654 RepID=UPI001BB0EF4A|nr:beta-1,4-galactosyltransferase 6-like [Lytechinus variegatus]